jgi:pimeloyl-ACP methyl ester carboxylesterase
VEIAFKKVGKGPDVVMIHGYPMDSRVWEEFLPLLAAEFTLWVPDIPGFGKSKLADGDGDFSLAEVARELTEWAEINGITAPVLIGHSMGGYIALEMIKQHPSRYNGLALFHSTAKDDSPEKKDSRTKVVQFVKDNGVLAFTSNFIQPLFADQNHPAIDRVKAITMDASERAVIGYARAMRDRKDNTGVLRDFEKPILILGGTHDKGIPVDSLKEQSTLNSRIDLTVVNDVGHMGMWERPTETAGILKAFLYKSCNSAGAR